MTDRAQTTYEVFRSGFRGTTRAPPPWDDLEPWMRDMARLAYLQGKLDAFGEHVSKEKS